MIRTAIAVLAALILAPASAAAADNLAGQASVIDGDTLEIHGTRIRRWGIDAPESSQLCRGEDSLQYRCGAKAANDLDALRLRDADPCLLLPTSALERITDSSQTSRQVRKVPQGDSCSAAIASFIRSPRRHARAASGGHPGQAHWRSLD
jgi:hypothetical protein